MTLDEIIAAVERGETGRELDAEIACKVKHPNLRPSRPDDFDGEFGYSPGDLKCETGFLQADRYLSSLDAAIPGENITFVMYQETSESWIAEDGSGDQQEWSRDCPTEIAARRAAGLRAWKEKKGCSE